MHVVITEMQLYNPAEHTRIALIHEKNEKQLNRD